MRQARCSVWVISTFVGIGLLGSACVARAAEGEWPWWRGPNRDGKSSETGLLKEWPAGGPKKLWQADDIGKGYSTVSVSGGLIKTASGGYSSVSG